MELTMPKNYSVISENELIYVDGGGKISIPLFPSTTPYSNTNNLVTLDVSFNKEAAAWTIGCTIGGAIAGAAGGPVGSGLGALGGATGVVIAESIMGNITYNVSVCGVPIF